MGLADTIAGVTAQVAKALGKPATLRLNGGAAYDASTGTAEPVPRDIAWDVAVGAYDYRSSAGLQLLPRTDAELTLTGSAQGLPRAPKKGDEVVMDAVTYQVVHVDPLHAGTGHAAYQVHVKR